MVGFHFFHIHVFKIRSGKAVDKRETLSPRLLVPSVAPNSTSTFLLAMEAVGDVSSFPPASNMVLVPVAIVLLLNLVSIVPLLVEDVLSPLSTSSVAPILTVIVPSIVEVRDDSSSSSLIVEVRDDSPSLPSETSTSPPLMFNIKKKERCHR
ncbi:hypothetical protein Adt_11707 [Abeliophyllum distichum]|uniref:Uncharacterized protein n=1 Tax=Abeliophyllum distichum TaxID=126358 RepID=A0ABD1UQC8_9LAMI